MADQQTVEQIKALATELNSTPLDELIRRPSDWGAFNLDECREDIQRIVALSVPFSALPVEMLPQAVANALRDNIKNCVSLFIKIKDFTIDQGNPTDFKAQIRGEAGNCANSLFPLASGNLAFLAYTAGDLSRSLTVIQENLSNIRTIGEKAKSDFEAKKSELDAIITETKNSAAEVGIAHFNQDFQNESKSNIKSANRWLIATGILAILTACYAGYALWATSTNPQATVSAQIAYSISKFILLVVLATATLWCGRMYKALLHQSVQNKFKANALKTFRAFVESAGTEATREAVLLETTRAIFASPATGFLDGADPPADGNLKVIEVVKALGSSKS